MNILNSIIYILFSAFDNLVILLIMFSLFKIPMKHIRYHILFVSLIIGYIIYNTRILSDATPIAFIAHYISLFLFVWLMFRIQVFYAMFISLIAYVVFGCFQMFIIFSAQSFLDFNINDLGVNLILTYSLQVITDGLLILICMVLRRNHIGFNFVPHDDLVRIKYTKENVLIFISVIIMISIIGIVFAITLETASATVLFITAGSALIILIALALKKEKEDDL